MRGVILAAGRGRRMGAYTATYPKCLLTIAGATLLDRQVRALRMAGASEVAVVTGWHAEAFDALALPRFENPRWQTSTMVQSLLAASPWLAAGVTLISYGDIVFPPAAAAALAQAPAAGVAVAYDRDWLALWRRRFPDPLLDAETFRLGPHGMVTEIGGGPASVEEVEGQYMGLLRLTPDGFAALTRVLEAHAGEALDMTALLARAITSGVPVRGVPVPGPWCEIDSPVDLALAERIVPLVDEGASGRLDDLLGLP